MSAATLETGNVAPDRTGIHTRLGQTGPWGSAAETSLASTTRSTVAGDEVRRPIRVLLAEDRPVARKLIVEALESEGEFEVIATARDGEGAVDAARAHSPDVIVLDVVMPGLSGLQATREIRRFTSAPLVLFTGVRLGVDELHKTAARAGADAVVLKPAHSVGMELLESLDPLRAKLRDLVTDRRKAAGAQRGVKV